ncbi:hypothetical protein GPECTOR_786g5 [Gonium pectorale]|uniref:Uncharacterized protein n=1 Tax=Gonium pectorale TaxID=33097 RepID=A0A150FVQ5_GONPE|nr:hypothetical protein GPECTOR_786g5 [Gonium pectorale]|eukprot:KXZ41110.1 hypothetical protein GPECTOR_786g5 [Gonium pectorale]
MLELLGLEPDARCCSADLLRGVSQCRTEQELLAVLCVMVTRRADEEEAAAAAAEGEAEAGAAGRRAARREGERDGSRRSLGGNSGGGGGFSASGEEAKRRVRAAWDKLRRGGLVNVAAAAATGTPAGALSYNAAAPQLPPYRVAVARAELRTHGTAAAATAAVLGGRGRSAARGDVQLTFDMEASSEGYYLSRHPLLASHDRVVRLEVGFDAALDGPRPQREAARGALERLAGEGFLFAGRLYRYCAAKDSSMWFLAVSSARPADMAWEPISNPIMFRPRPR